MTYILVLFLFGASTNIPGYTTRQSCEEAKKELTATLLRADGTPLVDHYAVCVKSDRRV